MRVFLSLLLVFIVTACAKPGRAPVSAYGTTEGVGTLGVHTVEEGDTLWTVSQRYDIDMRGIAAMNKLQPPYRLNEGQRLKLPPPYEYKVRRGDNIYTVSRLFKVGPSEIAQLNDLKAPYALRPNQILRLPTLNAISVPPVPGLEQTTPGQAATVEQVISEELPPPVSSAPMGEPPPGSFETSSLPPALQTPTQQAIQTPPRPNPITAETPKRASGRFLRPVNGRVVSSYGSKEGGFHNDGINIAAPRGTPVKAAENGVVVYAGDKLKGSGNLVLVRHDGRWMSAYAHMDKITVKRGDVVKYGQSIGTVGSTGSVDTPQLHFELRRGTEALNPQAYIDG